MQYQERVMQKRLSDYYVTNLHDAGLKSTFCGMLFVKTCATMNWRIMYERNARKKVFFRFENFKMSLNYFRNI